MQSDQIDYKIEGADAQYVEITLDPGETVVAEAGSVISIDEGIKMHTLLGDGSKKGFFGSIMSATRRVFTGESLFITSFTNASSYRRNVAFSAPYPGKIVPLDLSRLGFKIFCQKDAFLCGARGVGVKIAFQKRILTAMFGGEGLIMQELSGDGMAFIHAGGTLFEKELLPKQTLRVDVGCVVAYQPTVDFKITFVGGVKTAIFAKEGLFFAKMVGPGKVWLQSMPFSRTVGQIFYRALNDKKTQKELSKLS